MWQTTYKPWVPFNNKKIQKDTVFRTVDIAYRSDSSANFEDKIKLLSFTQWLTTADDMTISVNQSGDICRMKVCCTLSLTFSDSCPVYTVWETSFVVFPICIVIYSLLTSLWIFPPVRVFFFFKINVSFNVVQLVHMSLFFLFLHLIFHPQPWMDLCILLFMCLLNLA